MSGVTLADLQPDDEAGALALAETAMRAGQWSAELAQMLAMSQRDPRDLNNKIHALRLELGVPPPESVPSLLPIPTLHASK